MVYTLPLLSDQKHILYDFVYDFLFGVTLWLMLYHPWEVRDKPWPFLVCIFFCSDLLIIWCTALEWCDTHLVPFLHYFISAVTLGSYGVPPLSGLGHAVHDVSHLEYPSLLKVAGNCDTIGVAIYRTGILPGRAKLNLYLAWSFQLLEYHMYLRGEGFIWY